MQICLFSLKLEKQSESAQNSRVNVMFFVGSGYPKPTGCVYYDQSLPHWNHD